MRICDQPFCGKGASFGYPGERATRCSLHPTAGMVNVCHHKCNHPDGCNYRASFAYPGGRATRCAQHLEDGMVRVG